MAKHKHIWKHVRIDGMLFENPQYDRYCVCVTDECTICGKTNGTTDTLTKKEYEQLKKTLEVI